MAASWDPRAPGVLRLPSGRLVRGRGLGHPTPEGLAPTFALYVFHQQPPPVPWEHRWVLWPDFGLPADDDDAAAALGQVWERAADERVEVACWGGRGRTGTALACLAVLDGLPAGQAIAHVRAHYDARAVETREQEVYVAHFAGRSHWTRSTVERRARDAGPSR